MQIAGLKSYLGTDVAELPTVFLLERRFRHLLVREHVLVSRLRGSQLAVLEHVLPYIVCVQHRVSPFVFVREVDGELRGKGEGPSSICEPCDDNARGI